MRHGRLYAGDVQIHLNDRCNHCSTMLLSLLVVVGTVCRQAHLVGTKGSHHKASSVELHCNISTDSSINTNVGLLAFMQVSHFGSRVVITANSLLPARSQRHVESLVQAVSSMTVPTCASGCTACATGAVSMCRACGCA